MSWLRRNPFQRKQALAAPSRYYGDGGTIHHTGQLDVEVDGTGTVVAVWFRCQHLPFQQVPADPGRAEQMRHLYASEVPALTGVEVLDSGEL